MTGRLSSYLQPDFQLCKTVGDSFERLTPQLAWFIDRRIDAFLGHRYHRKRRIISETCRAEHVALVMVTHTAEIRAQFDRVDELSDINQVEHSVV